MTYKPNYETTIRTSTVIHKENTSHTDTIDWENYPFDDPEHFGGMCCKQEEKDEHREKLKQFLRVCEQYKDKEVFASNYGGWPRIWKKVLWAGMASAWPYWTPRPTICIEGTFMREWVDWTSITGVKD